MSPVLSLGSLYITPYSLAILFGALSAVALFRKKKDYLPLLPSAILGALILGHICWVLFCSPMDTHPEGKLYMILHPWEGGYTLYGALLGGILGAVIAAKAIGIHWLDALDSLAPGACAAIIFARIGEVFTGEGIGAYVESEWACFFPLSVCTYQDEFYQEWHYAIWFWEACAALVLLIILLRQAKKPVRGRQTVLFLTILSSTQIFLEQMRWDNYLRLIIFVRVNQLAALATLIAVLVTLIVRRRPGRAKVITCLATLVLASLSDMATEFVFDKYEYAFWLYLSLPLAVASCAVMLWVWKKKKGVLPALLICLSAAALLIAYSLKNWNEIEMTADLVMIRDLILYGTMIVDLLCIDLTIFLNLRHGREGNPGPSYNIPE